MSPGYPLDCGQEVQLESRRQLEEFAEEGTVMPLILKLAPHRPLPRLAEERSTEAAGLTTEGEISLNMRSLKGKIQQIFHIFRFSVFLISRCWIFPKMLLYT